MKQIGVGVAIPSDGGNTSFNNGTNVQRIYFEGGNSGLLSGLLGGL